MKKQKIIFELSMPNVGSWNGRWTGENSKYTVMRKIDGSDIVGKSFYYDFGDGWGASVKVREAEPREKATNRFAGYEWMIDSIIRNGEIRIDN